MISVYFLKILRFLPLLALPFWAWWMPPVADAGQPGFSPEKINLALRRTADGLLRATGDSTSRIPAIEQSASNIWRVRLEQPFVYEQLPALLQASLDLHGIQLPYQVTLRRCDDATIDLGYHQLDFLQNQEVACGGRTMPEGCHFIEIAFLENDVKRPFWADKAWMILLILGVGAIYGYFLLRKKSVPLAPTVEPAVQNLESGEETEWLGFGNSRLDVAGQVLVCNGIRQKLTFRETKLLRLFISSPDRLLERDFILQQVWADEGVLVGRSLDVFVSRLRKKLVDDPSVGIVAVHGVGYRLETVR